MKKKWCYVVSMLLIVLVLGACANGKKKAAQTKVPTLIWYQIGVKSNDTDKVMAKFNQLVEKKIGVKVAMRMIDFGDYAKKMQIINSSGEPYDIAFTARDYSYSDNTRKGAYLDISQLVKKYAPDIAGRLTGGKVDVDGKSYGIPDDDISASNFYWTFNKDMLKRYNLSVDNVHSLQSLEPILKQFKTANQDDTVKFILAVDKNFRVKEPYDYLLADTIPLGISLKEDTGKIENVLEDPQTLKDFETMHRYYQEGYINKDVARSTDSSINLANKNASWFVRAQESAEATAGEKSIEQIVNYPVVMKAYTDPVQGIGNATVALHAISATSKHPKEALKLLNLINTDKELATLLVYGIKGEHYTLKADDTITFTDKQADYNMGAWCLLDSDLLPKTQKQTTEEKQASEAYVAHAKKSPALGFFFDTSKVKTEIAAVQSTMAQYQTDLNVGAVNPTTTLPKVLKELKQAGLPTIQKEAQQQYDKWRTAQHKE